MVKYQSTSSDPSPPRPKCGACSIAIRFRRSVRYADSGEGVQLGLAVTAVT
jgi:hypothetical protein